MKYKRKRNIALMRRKARQVRGKMRRWYLDKFNKNKIHRGISERLGVCKMCGQCCRLVFKCPFLKKEGKCETCSIYNFRPAQCRHFPIDSKDLKDLGRSCGYSFPNKNKNKDA